ncbi:hypothetical protein CL656_05130 [bacterium]|nr:hypothetical protein [bacterium]|tara:strand:- start:6431 stop:7423 length:993 start_codon:yes stop_codon:yes gene_type:complete
MNSLVSTQTPLRVGLLGGGTDLPEISNKIGGAVLNFAFDQYVYVTIKKHSGLFEEKFRLQYSETELCTNVQEIKNDIIRCTLLYFEIKTPLVIQTISDIPSSSGLGSSSSFTVGLVNAVNKMFDLKIPNSDVPEVSYRIERSIPNSSIGRQDIYAASTGGMNLFEFNERTSISPINNSQYINDNLINNILLIWTGIHRSANEVLSQQVKSIDKDIDIYKKLKKLPFQGFEILSKANPNFQEEFCKLLNINREIKYKLSDKIAPKYILEIEKEIIRFGAISTKLLGAGGGGFILAIFKDKQAAYDASLALPYTNLPVHLDLYGSRVTQFIK